MANFFSIQDGNMLDPSVCGYSLSSGEVMNNTTGTMLLTSNYLYSVNATSDGYPLNGIALNLSSRAASPTGILGLTFQRIASSGVFLDSSSNNFSITTVGSAYQNTFTPFSPNGWSAFFNGTTDYIATSTNSALNLSGVPYTIEFWAYPSVITGQRGFINILGDSGGANAGINFYQDAANIRFNDGTLVTTGSATTNNPLSVGVWTHIALVSPNPNSHILYVNGVSSVEYAGKLVSVNTNKAFIGNWSALGGYFNGAISNLRILKGTALYTTQSFTPSSSKLTTTGSDTSLLTLQDIVIKDNSSNNIRLSAGSTGIRDVSPFASISLNPDIHGGSGYFGQSPTLTIADNSTNTFKLSGVSYTLECWIYPLSIPTTATGIINICQASDSYGLNFYIDNTVIKYNNGKDAPVGSSTNTGTVSVNKWYHLALSKDQTANVTRLYVNGVSAASYTGEIFAGYSPTRCLIGTYHGATSPFNGYISNVRLVKGTSLYNTNTFTPSTSPLTNITNTSLLLNTNNIGFKSAVSETYAVSGFTAYNGVNNLTPYPQHWQIFKFTNPIISNYGDIINYTLSSSNPNELSLIGGRISATDTTGISRLSTSGSVTLTSFKPYSNFNDSFYINGVNNWFVIPSNRNFRFNGDFTIEFWLNTSLFSLDGAESRRIFSIGPLAVNAMSLLFYNGTAATSMLSLYTNGIIITGTISAADGNWHHVAVSRYNNIMRLYVDGVQSGNAVNNVTDINAGLSNPISIGTTNNTSPGRFQGYINQFRIVNGTALYTTSAFSPPTSPLENIPNTVFLLKNGISYNQALISDTTKNIANRSLTLSATQLSAVSPFGVGVDSSIYFNGTSNIRIPADSSWNLSKDFTIEFWVNTSVFNIDAGQPRRILFFGPADGTTSANTLNILLNDGTNPALPVSVNNNAVIIAGTIPVANGNWHHIAVCRSSGILKLFVDGIQSGNSVASSQVFDSSVTNGISIGAANTASGAGRLIGSISNLRIINGFGLYPDNFTPSKVQLKPIIGTSLFINSSSYNLSSYIYSPLTLGDFHVGGALKGFDSESRTIEVESTIIPSLYIHDKGTLIFPLTSSKTLTLVGSAGLQITSGATLNIGTSSAVIPLSTTHTINLSNNQIDVYDGSNFNVYGFPKNAVTNLVNDTISGSRAFTTVDPISNVWRVGDIISFKPNLIYKNSFDTLRLSSFTGSNTFTTTSPSVFTHTGSATYGNVAGVYNLTRNVIIASVPPLSVISIGGSNYSCIRFKNLSNGYINNCQITNLYNYKTKSMIIQDSNFSGNLLLSSNVISSFLGASEIVSTPSVSSYSTYFDSTGHIDVGSQSTFDLLGIDSTVECFFNQVKTNTSIAWMFEKGGLTGQKVKMWGAKIDASNGLWIVISTGAASGSGSVERFIDYISNNRWYHLAICRVGGTTGSPVLVFLDGILKDTFTAPAQSADGYPLRIGTDGFDATSTSATRFYGYISNFRVLTGVSLYNSNFIPPTQTLSAIRNTAFLALHNNSFTDGSVNNISITNNFSKGLANIVNSSPFYFNEPNVNNLKLNNNIFTNTGVVFSNQKYNNVEFKNNYMLNPLSSNNGLAIVYCTASTMDIFNNTVVGSSFNYGTYLLHNTITGTYGAINFNTGYQGMYVAGVNTGTIVGGSINSSREGIYVDASSSNLSSVLFQNILVSDNKSVGFKVSGNNLNYSTPVVLNINGLSSINNLDSGFEGYNISGNLKSIVVDNNLNNGIKTIIGSGPIMFDDVRSHATTNILYYLTASYTGTFQTSSFSPNGTITSAYLSGGGSLYNFNNTANVNLASGNTTIECWVYPISSGTIVTKDDVSGSTYPSYTLSINNTKGVTYGIGSGTSTNQYQVVNTPINLITFNTWNHIAAINSNSLNSLLVYINGVLSVSAVKTATMGNGIDPMYVGGRLTTNNSFYGYLNNLRITKSVVYNSNFIPNINYGLLPNTTLLLVNYNNVYYSYLSSYNPINILSAFNYSRTLINKTNIICPRLSESVPLTINNINKLEDFRLENSILSARYPSVNPLSISTIRPKLEGSYLFNNCNSNIYQLSALALTGYQSDIFLESGIAVMRENGLSGNHYRWNAAGKISYDKFVRTTGNYASEKLEPTSTTVKLRSVSKYISVQPGTSLSIRVYVYKSAGYTGTAPRLILKRNSALGFADTVLATSTANNGNWGQLAGNTPTSLTFGTFEVYVECSGSIGCGSINIDDWDFS